jgi:hypothetical protein
MAQGAAMAVIPRSFLTIGARLLSARAAVRLRRERDAARVQGAVLDKLIPSLAGGFVWSHVGVETGMTHEEFRKRVPLHAYADLAPHIDSMKRGADDVLWPGGCQIYALSSGTTEDAPKYIPMTEPMLGHFKTCGIDSALWYMARTRSTKILRGRHLYTGGSTALAPIADSGSFEAYSGELGAIAALNMPRWMETHLYEPGTEIGQMSEWPEKVAATAERTVTLDIRLLAGMPNWALVVAEALRATASRGGRQVPNLQVIWPDLECFTHGGIPIAPFQDELRSVLGPTVAFHEVYRAAEGFIAAQDAESAAGLRLMLNSGIYYEFLPMSAFDESRLSALGGKAVPLSGVATGVDYALVLTTPSGFARYVIGDVVRFTSTQPPRIIYVGRTRLQLDAFGERVIEKEITDALLAVCRRNAWTIVNFHVAPIFPSSVTSKSGGRHEWWVELKAGTAITPTGPIIAIELDLELRKLNRDYDSKRGSGLLDAPFVRLVMPGVFEHWMRYRGKWGGQNKMQRCRSDRVIANELGGALQFAKD